MFKKKKNIKIDDFVIPKLKDNKVIVFLSSLFLSFYFIFFTKSSS